jgi:diadenosine tetraphosphate (Ap4A) HIT family hydrolase
MNGGNTLARMAPNNESTCPICRDNGPSDVIAELPATWVSAPRIAPLPGYACVIFKRHVVEPFELPQEEMLAFFADAMTAARVLVSVFAPAKMNYEIHGNTIPHLHVHLYPRYAGDPFEGEPIDPRRCTFERSAEDLLQLGTEIAAAAS